MELTITVPDEVAARLAELAAERQMTPEDCAAETLRDALGLEFALPGMTAAETAAYIAEGEADVAAGRVVSHEEVMRDLRDIIAQAKARRGE